MNMFKYTILNKRMVSLLLTCLITGASIQAPPVLPHNKPKPTTIITPKPINPDRLSNKDLLMAAGLGVIGIIAGASTNNKTIRYAT